MRKAKERVRINAAKSKSNQFTQSCMWTYTCFLEGRNKVKGIVNAFHTAFTTPAYTGLLWLAIRIFVAYEFISAGLEKWESGKWLGAGTGGAIAGFLKGALTKSTGAHPEVQPWYT